MKKKRKWIKWAVLLLIVLAVVLGLSLSRTTQSVAYTQMEVTTGDLVTYYNFDGVVKADHVQTITAAQGGIVDTVYVDRNQQVKEGDKLVKFESGEVIRADIDGEITSLPIAEGDVVTAGEKVCEIMDMEKLSVALNVDEYDVRAVTPGTMAEITVLATDTVYTGEIVSLDKNGIASGDLSYYTAEAELGDANGVYPGMQVSAKVLRGQALGASIVRMEAIAFDEYNQPYVLMYASDGKSTVQVPVTVGISDGIYAEIIDGVSAGDIVLKSSGMTMAELMELMRAQGPMAR